MAKQKTKKTEFSAYFLAAAAASTSAALARLTGFSGAFWNCGFRQQKTEMGGGFRLCTIADNGEGAGGSRTERRVEKGGVNERTNMGTGKTCLSARVCTAEPMRRAPLQIKTTKNDVIFVASSFVSAKETDGRNRPNKRLSRKQPGSKQ